MLKHRILFTLGIKIYHKVNNAENWETKETEHNRLEAIFVQKCQSKMKRRNRISASAELKVNKYKLW